MTDLQRWIGADILSLGMAADEARRAALGVEVTYLRVHVVSASDVRPGLVVPEPASEVRLYETPATYDGAVALVAALRAAAGARRVVAFSMGDLEERAQGGWGARALILRGLVAAGLSDVAELEMDRVADAGDSVQALADAGAEPRRLTIGGGVKDRLDVLARVSRCRVRVRRPLAFAPLPRRAPAERPTTGYDDLRMVALARLAAAGDQGAAGSPTIEVDWTLHGPKLAQVALTFGADHLDAVAATSDPALGRRRQTVEEVERNIRAAGFVPRELRWA